MTKTLTEKDGQRLRRIALSAQGLLQANTFGYGLSGVVHAINHLGYVQIDTISVVERAHHHTLFNRVPRYQTSMLDELLTTRKIFEYWAHAAAFLPINDFRFSLPYKNAIKSGQTHWYKNPDKKLMQALLTRIRQDGPLRSRDLESHKPKRQGWWDWKPAKKALEQLYMEGELMVSNREGFQKTYDLTERVLPPSINHQIPSLQEWAEHLINQQLNYYGVVSLKGLTYLRRSTELRQMVKYLINERLASKDLEQYQTHNGEFLLVEAGALEQPLKRFKKRLKILSPFDNSIIQRERLKTLFGFDYQLECYLPAAKRRYGYFALPLLYGDKFLGRMDCKVHRKRQHLEIITLHWERQEVNKDEVAPAFIEALKSFQSFQQCETLSLKNVFPKKFTSFFKSLLSR
ncbi:MAG: crosslink repair DNA glycosylase YcaQ family protein [Pseudomonadota bacterium]